jgi:hypothetical protein
MSVAGLGSWKHGTSGTPSVLTDFSVDGAAKIMSLNIDLDSQEVDMTTWKNGGYQSFEQTFKNGTISAVYKFDPTVYAQLGALYSSGVFVDWENGPVGDDVGDPRISGSMFLKKLGSPQNSGEGLKINVDFRIDGPVTFDTFA